MSTPPKSERKPHAKRRSDSRTLILEAAVQTLAEDGYGGATTVVIQRVAGVSRGRLLHYFPSRDDLLIAAAQHLAAERINEMEEWFDVAPEHATSGTQRIDYAVTLLWRTFRQPYFWAAMELWIAARTDVALRAELREAERRLGRAIEHVIATMFGPVHSSHPEFASLRELLFTSMRGTALTYAIDTRDPDADPHLELWKQLAHRMLVDSPNLAIDSQR